MDGYVINARDKPGLLVAFMKELAGNARVSFEGDLTKCEFSSVPQLAHEPDGALQRNTISPRLDYVILPLTPETIAPILGQVLPGGRCVHDIIHIQIERNGELAFSACDNFHPDCTWAWLASEPLLRKLRDRQVVRSFEKCLGQ